MIRGYILSHTQMGRSGFCTNIAVQINGQWQQVRPRLAPNQGLTYGDVGYTRECMERDWLPGHLVEIPDPIAVDPAYQRPTHPEDRIINLRAATLYTNCLTPEQLRALAAHFQQPTVAALFPQMANGTHKPYVPDGIQVTQSVGYVEASSVSFYQDWGKLRALVTDASGSTYDVPLKDTQLLKTARAGQQISGPVLVRLALAGGFAHQNWANSNHPSRCYVMASHIMQ